MRENSSAIYVARGASYLFIQNLASTIIPITAFALILNKIKTLWPLLKPPLTYETKLLSIHQHQE